MAVYSNQEQKVGWPGEASRNCRHHSLDLYEMQKSISIVRYAFHIFILILIWTPDLSS